VNEGNFLERHMISTVRWIKERTDIELYGVGIGFDVTRYYGPGSPTLSELQVGPDLLTVVSLAITENWFEAKKIQRPVLRPERSRSGSSTSRRRRGSAAKDETVR